MDSNIDNECDECDEYDEYDEYDETDDDFTSDEIEEIRTPLQAPKIQKNEKFSEKVQNIMVYKNQEMINKIGEKANKILKIKPNNRYRDHFFPILISEMGFLTGAEIGVDKGQFSQHILNKTKIEKYYCIDTWQNDFGSNCIPGYFDKNGDKRYDQAKEILNKYGNRVVIMRKTSIDASKDISNNSLDFCYIDGDHSLAMLLDLYAWMPKLKIGGICSGHDFKNGPRSGISDFWGKQLDYQVKTCVEYYCQKYGYKICSVGGRIKSFWFVKNCESPMIF